MEATTSSSCSGFFNIRANPVEPRVRSSPRHGSSGCAKVDGVAMWFINGVASAFFASLDRCSCIRIATHEDAVDDANDVPLIFNDGNYRHDGRSGGRRRSGKGKKAGASIEDF
ncbi:Mixed-linked glucan synthase [Actinidia chinensis var. chinensis]|uniref:Mixed-linked glucan synthase n=1 Tax=Actinidia chinensis var. chinensis TaxID=1590841 RepID=A0A2R6QY78_ACTCC|nr:Mixed-linked glucan synthase [Actinidia chinensis var. chinensis]